MNIIRTNFLVQSQQCQIVIKAGEKKPRKRRTREEIHRCKIEREQRLARIRAERRTEREREREERRMKKRQAYLATLPEEDEDMDHPSTRSNVDTMYTKNKGYMNIRALRISLSVDQRKELSNGEKTEGSMEHKYLFTHVNEGSECVMPLTKEDSIDPLTLSAMMLRECPVCLTEKAGINILYFRSCQHHICRECFMKTAAVAQQASSVVRCGLCRETMGDMFSFVRDERGKGKMMIYEGTLLLKNL